LYQHKSKRTLEHYVGRLEDKLADQRKIQQAKTILMETRKLSEQDAYDLLRAQAMAKRQPIEVMAQAIIQAHAVLDF
jgi:AmiR/NasT family two-component response regulator